MCSRDRGILAPHCLSPSSASPALSPSHPLQAIYVSSFSRALLCSLILGFYFPPFLWLDSATYFGAFFCCRIHILHLYSSVSGKKIRKTFVYRVNGQDKKREPWTFWGGQVHLLLFLVLLLNVELIPKICSLYSCASFLDI